MNDHDRDQTHSQGHDEEVQDVLFESHPEDQRPIDVDSARQLIESLESTTEATEEGLPAAQALMHDAVRERASDIHLDPETRGLRVRMRIDGAMRDVALLAPTQGDRVVNQLKGLAGIDPVAQFTADEARFSFQEGETEIDARLAMIPCLDGQKVTVRVLNPRQFVSKVHDLGLSRPELDRITHWFQSLGGMFIVSGPVGSGKTTTLYALVHALKLQAYSVSTLEDPVEYSVDGINQIQVDVSHGLTFAEGIKALARHDPDVLLVGELRDAATARSAYGAAAVGRTVLTTTHARDAAGVVASLRYHGLDDRDIATTLSVVVAQRLVRKLCPHCRRESAPTEDHRRWFELIGVSLPESSWQPGQCDHCRQSGYFGQTGVFEVWRLEEEDYHLLLRGATEREIRESLAARDCKSLLADALDKAREGVTTLSEVQHLHLAGPALAHGAATVRSATSSDG